MLPLGYNANVLFTGIANAVWVHVKLDLFRVKRSPEAHLVEKVECLDGRAIFSIATCQYFRGISQLYHSLHKLCIITLHKLCIIIMQMHNPSHFCITTISLFLALGAQSKLTNVLPKRSASGKWPLLPDYANKLR